jgi:dTDP-4-dehydrorhamnose reductase
VTSTLSVAGTRPTGAPVAVSGAHGRLGRAILEMADARHGRSDDFGSMVGWGRPELDLDEPASWARLLDRDRPGLVIHAAAMTDVDGCARQPELAVRRNGEATGALAEACRARGVALVVISTNEVFAGDRDDGHGYVETDEPAPGNAYGASKLAGEENARQAFGSWSGLWVVRTAWLYGPPGNDFPEKIVAAADRLPADEPLPVVSDEVGSPTFAGDVASGILALVTGTDGGRYHLVNAGMASRREWADRVLAVRRPGRLTRAISGAEFDRPSLPPRWGVLATTKAAGVGVELRPWQAALDDYLHR